jgi:Rrf2 family transcriptional regulator, nitric oxide-sensitive transcriptional repressor
MRLTVFTDNALRCLIYLGTIEGGTATVREIATHMTMSEDHLLKVVKRLVQLGLVRSIRGRKGGIQLTRAPEEIRVAAVIRATEDNVALVSCFDPASPPCPIAPACVLAGALDEALGAFFAVLDRYTLADLVRQQQELATLVGA